MLKLKSAKIFNNEMIMEIVERILPELEDNLPTGMYFPVPISREMNKGNEFSIELVLRFHYDFIRIDENQNWIFKKNHITGKVLKLFMLNLFYEKSTKLYFIEYWNERQWDKCYLECKISPMLALSIVNNNGEQGLKIKLNNQKTDSIYLNSFRIDKKERCFVKSKNYGEILLADTPRFWFLDNINKTGSHFVFKNKEYPLNFT